MTIYIILHFNLRYHNLQVSKLAKKMSAMNFISNLKPEKAMWKIKMKVIRLWKQYQAAGGEIIEMVLVDSKVKFLIVYILFKAQTYYVFQLMLSFVFFLKGDKIYTSIKKDLVSQFDILLRQGTSMLLFNFSMTPFCGSIGEPTILIRLDFFLPPVFEYVKISRIISGFQGRVLKTLIGAVVVFRFFVF